MKILLFLLIVFVFANRLSAQYKETLRFRDEDGKNVSAKKATELLQIIKTDDTTWTYNYYNILGPLKKSVQSNTSDGTVYHGEYYTYRRGVLDTIGYYDHGNKAKTWSILTSGGRLLKKIEFQDGKQVSEIDSTQENERLKKAEEEARGRDSVVMKVEVESEFVGGQKGWADYLGHNLKYPDRAIDNTIQGTVVIQFIVDKEGSIQNIRINRSIEYSLDKESFRIILNSPQWKPAVQNGRMVKSYKRQPIIFKLTR